MNGGMEECMMNRTKIIILISTILFFLICGIIFIIFFNKFKLNNISIRKTQESTESQILMEISLRTGIQPSWLALREYIYCDALQKGMSKHEVENALSKIGDLVIYDLQIDFDNRLVDSHLAPIMVFYDKPGPEGKLIQWRRSYEHNLGQPLAHCEQEQ